MSRIGKQPITVPDGVTVAIADRVVKVTGPKGELEQAFSPNVTIEVDGALVTVTPDDENNKESKSLWGTYTRLVGNMIHGVTEGFSRVLEFNGVGWRAEMKGSTLVLNVGYSHPVEYKLPEGTSAAVEKNVITISGIDKQQVGQVAAEIRSVRKPEPYKGKGIKYQEEVIKRKAGKQAKTAA